ncbi:MAG: hypothetical protein M3135_01505, partial [Actinomycetota bacterium]|nr:hypothetical protein [Actinomycetota bacterium]
MRRSGVPVAVAVDIPKLELDRQFTYLLPEEHAPGTGLLVSVPFHGRTVRGWVLGPTRDVPGRVLPVRKVLSRMPVFDDRLLRLARWIGERYVTPLSVVLDRLHPPRVASEEKASGSVEHTAVPKIRGEDLLGGYDGGPDLLAATADDGGAFVVRPLPDDEHGACLEAVTSCLRAGRDAVVIVPEAEPLPRLAGVLAEAFGAAALVFAGGDRR